MPLCTLCPRACSVDRTKTAGFCGEGGEVRLARVGLHAWEEPCIAYGAGAGTIFFSGCNLGCVYCQNYAISRGGKGKIVSTRTLADEMLSLQEKGASCIDLVTPTHFTTQIVAALELVKPALHIPVVWNSGGYERPETLRLLAGAVDIFLPDFKYVSPALAEAYSAVPDYFAVADKALKTMYDLVGYAVFDGEGHMTRGVLTRHLVLPGSAADSIALLDHLAKTYDPARFALSLMSQYFPTENCRSHPKLGRRVTSLEYEKVVRHAGERGFLTGFTQERASASPAYVPAFDYDG